MTEDVTRWRTGRKIGNTIYRQLGPEPSDQDPVIGFMSNPADATIAVQAVNQSTNDSKAAR